MKRTNTFKVVFEQPRKILSMGRGCAVLWNVLNYKRRQSFFSGEFNWDCTEEYDSFKHWVGSATAQQIIRKNNSSWKSFFALLRKKEEGKLPGHVKKVGPPGYWKDRKTGELVIRILVRNDCYRVEGRNVKLPKDVKGRIKGNPHWNGKQGRLELQYDRVKEYWYAHQTVDVEPRHQPKGRKKAFVDLGVRYILTAIIEGINKPIAYDGAPLLTDWWYWNKRIATHQSELKDKNGKHTSKRLRKLYRTRKLRFRQAVKTYIHRFVEKCYGLGVSDIIAGNLNGILSNHEKMNGKSNSMTHNFWSHRYITDRLKWTAENYGMKLELINERGTSSQCPWCNSKNIVRRGRLFKCKSCGVEAHRDVVGALNISLVHRSEGDVNRVMAHPQVEQVNLKGIPRL